MKKFKKLIPALCMLLVSAVLVGTSTYAWFSMNDTVSVTNLQITAKSDSVFLLIGEGKQTAGEVQAGNKTNIDTEVKSELLPSAHVADVSTEAKAAAENAWYYQKAKGPTSSVGDGNNVTITTDKFGNYVIKKTYSLTLASGSLAQNKIDAQVVITDANDKTATDRTFDPVRVLITTAAKSAEFGVKADANNTDVKVAGISDTNKGASATIHEGAVNDTTVIEVNVYIYYNGADTNVFTTNIAKLAGGNISVYFTVTK